MCEVRPGARRRQWAKWRVPVTYIATPAAALLPHEFQRYAAIPMGIAFIWLGFALWFPKRAVTADAALHPVAAE